MKAQPILKWVVVGGSVIMGVGSVVQLTQVKEIKGAIMPVVSLLVAVSALSYALGGEEIRIVPKA